MIPMITESTIDNVTREAFKRDVFPYCFEKLKEMNKNNPHLLEAISVISSQLFMHNETEDVSEEAREINRLRCVSGMLIVINLINTQLEINELKEMFG